MLRWFIVTIVVFSISFDEILCFSVDATVDYYENLILDQMRKVKDYKLPKNARSFKSKISGPPKEFGSFDFIIAGAGSTGSVVASRLSEVTDWNILVLEAGDFGNNFTSIPKMGYDVNIYSEYNWGYVSTPQKTSCLGLEGARCPYPRGKGIGGTSLLNALIYARGNVVDFEKWCKMGNPGWCYDDVLPYFKKSESIHKNDPDAVVDDHHHGEGGLLHVAFPLPRSEQCKVFFKASQEIGYNMTDINGREQLGVTPFQLNTRHGRRHDGGTAFLVPFLHRKNLKILTKSFVTKILIGEDKVACGVLFTHNGREYKATAKREVIVCQGAIGSPQLLMLSGIGPKNHLEKLDIPVIQDLEVGSQLSDHVQIYGLTFSSNLSEPLKSLRENIKDFLKGRGILTEGLTQQGGGYFQTRLEKNAGYPDVEIDFYHSNATSYALTKSMRWKEDVNTATAGINLSSSFKMFVVVLHTKSMGTVRLKTASPYEYPLIDSNCLSDPEGSDIEQAYESVQLALKLIETEAFRKINAKLETKPLKQCKQYKFLTKEYWYCALPYQTGHDNHPATSCKMGSDPEEGSVVDPTLKVHGVEKLRVADASVIPISSSAHINAICYMIGEKVSDIIKKEYGVV